MLFTQKYFKYDLSNSKNRKKDINLLKVNQVSASLLNPTNRLSDCAMSDLGDLHVEVVGRTVVLLHLLVVHEAAVLQKTTSLLNMAAQIEI